MKRLITYFTLAYLMSWAIWLPLYSKKLGISDLPTLPYNHALGGLGPMLAAILTTIIYEKRKLFLLLKRALQIQPISYFTIALFGPFVLYFLACTIAYFVNYTPFKIQEIFISKEFPQFSFIVFFFYNLLFFGFGEEMGWRGYALPHLQAKMQPIYATLLLTAFWALWHLPLFLYRPGYATMDVAGVIGWVFSLLTGSILLTWLFNGSKGSILICATFHSTIDVTFTADSTNKNIVNYMGFLITIWGVATIFIIKNKQNKLVG